MNANFDDPLKLTNGRMTVAARGPCVNWQADEVSAVVKDVRITRGGVVVASSPGSTTVQNGSQAWWLDVSSSSRLNPGPARADATLTVTRTDNTTYDDPWWTDVQLRQ